MGKNKHINNLSRISGKSKSAKLSIYLQFFFLSLLFLLTLRNGAKKRNIYNFGVFVFFCLILPPAFWHIWWVWFLGSDWIGLVAWLAGCCQDFGQLMNWFWPNALAANSQANGSRPKGCLKLVKNDLLTCSVVYVDLGQPHLVKSKFVI